MNRPLSVIVPVYNVRLFLEACLDSILAQTFSDFEVILVDDGSTDGSGELCDRYAENDSRVRVVHQENQGLSGARNSGAALAKGDWLAFVDSDDLLPATAFADMMACTSCEVDIVIGKIASFTENLDQLISSKEDWHGLDVRGMTGAEALAAALKQSSVVLWSACRNYIRRSFWEKTQAAFQVGITSEDMHLIPRLQMASRGIALCDTCVYYYRRSRPQSITTGKSLQRELCFCQVITYLREYFAEHPEYRIAEPAMMEWCGRFLYGSIRSFGAYTKTERKQLLAAALPHADLVRMCAYATKWKPFFVVLGSRMTYRLMMQLGLKR